MSSHSHLDQGSFYFESDGVAWATDLGMQDYNSLESAGVDLWDMLQDSERWTVFRIGPFSHNILTVNGHTPKVNHPVAFSRTWTPDNRTRHDRVGAEMDLTELYAEDLDSCKRAVYLYGDLEIVDLIQAGDSACTVRWAMCTEAKVSLQPDPDIDLPGYPFADHRIKLEADGRKRTLVAVLLDEWNGRPAAIMALPWMIVKSKEFPGTGLPAWSVNEAPNPGLSSSTHGSSRRNWYWSPMKLISWMYGTPASRLFVKPA
jgi:hypothetical protein